MVDGEKIIPFVRQFYDSPSTFLWEDDTGDVRRVRQGEGGEQGPSLFSLGQHRAMVAVQAELKECGSSHSWTTFMSCVLQTGSGRSTCCWKEQLRAKTDLHPPGKDEAVECIRVQASHG